MENYNNHPQDKKTTIIQIVVNAVVTILSVLFGLNI